MSALYARAEADAVGKLVVTLSQKKSFETLYKFRAAMFADIRIQLGNPSSKFTHWI